MVQYLVGKDSLAYAAKVGGGAISTVDEIDDLAVGAVAFFLENGTFIGTGSTVTAGSKFFMVVGLDAERNFVSSLMEAKEDYVKQEYTAPEKHEVYIGSDGQTAAITSGAFGAARVGLQVECTVASSGSGDFRAGTTALLKVVSGHTGVAPGTELAANTDLVLGAIYEIINAGTPDAYDSGQLTPTGAAYSLNLPGSLVVGSIAEITITKITEQRTKAEDVHRYEYVVKTGDVNQDIVDGLVTSVNADVDAIVTATAMSTDKGIKLEAKDNDVIFQATVNGDVIGSADIMQNEVGLSNNMVKGLGRATQVAKLESDWTVNRGNTSFAHLPAQYWSVPSNVVSGETYDTYVFTFGDKNTPFLNPLAPYRKTVFLAVPDGATMQSDLETVIGKLFQ